MHVSVFIVLMCSVKCILICSSLTAIPFNLTSNNQQNFFFRCTFVPSQFFPPRSSTAYSGRILFSFWFSSEISDVFEQQRDALFWLCPDAVNDAYMFEAPTVLFVLYNTVGDGLFRGAI